MASTTVGWRKWHRWIGFPATIFLIFAACTGFLLAFTEFFGEEEALRERTRGLVSPVSAAAPADTWEEPIARAVTAVNAMAPGAPLDKIEIQFKGDHPTVTIFTGKPAGGEDRKFVVSAATGKIDKVEAYADKPFLNRLHSGEAFGDGGLVLAMAWAIALIALAVSGLTIYLRIRSPNPVGVQKVFW